MVETRRSSASNKRPLCSSSSPSSPPPNYFKRSKTAAATTEAWSTDGASVPPVEIIGSVKESELVASDLQATVVENPVLADLDKSPVVVEAEDEDEDEDEDSPQSLENDTFELFQVVT